MSHKVGLILIGDELLNGSRQDKHQLKAIELLGDKGMQLAWVKIIGDDEALITETLSTARDSGDITFSFGGIGATPDDLTRACAAKAFGVRLHRHPQLEAIMREEFGDAAYPNRIRMAELPFGATLVPNSVNRIAGFKLANIHFFPGFPSMAWPMMAWCLDTFYRADFDTDPIMEQRWILEDMPESELIPTMEDLMIRFPRVKISSLPSTENRLRIDFGLKARQQDLSEAAQWLIQQLDALGANYRSSSD